jgi:hypothetical protein
MRDLGIDGLADGLGHRHAPVLVIDVDALGDQRRLADALGDEAIVAAAAATAAMQGAARAAIAVRVKKMLAAAGARQVGSPRRDGEVSQHARREGLARLGVTRRDAGLRHPALVEPQQPGVRQAAHFEWHGNLLTQGGGIERTEMARGRFHSSHTGRACDCACHLQ